jgi:hypothetical protein
MMVHRFMYLTAQAAKSILIHVHIPKAGGTALSAALSSNCQCTAEKKIVDGVAQPNCKACKKVKGKRVSMSYSISRSTGWRLGVHSPYSVIRYALTMPKFNITQYNFNPVYVVMLRSPYDRFISEATRWVDKPGVAVDWSIVNVKNGTKVFYSGISSTALDFGNTTAAMQKNVKLYASLPAHFIFHNRQSKMIGGAAQDFNMYFDPQIHLGSRWRGRGDVGIDRVQERAYRALSAHSNVLFGLQERFAEFICILEIVYGRMYHFDWKPEVHSHNKKKAFTKKAGQGGNSRIYDETHDIWLKNNAADVKLYFAAEMLFEVQFKVALDLLRNRVKRDGEGVLRTTPHCQGFI